ncbi:hypothetical protein NC652_019617 [Populus alba x Populus x berolinensis]|nr:hypothetical protein NC652_019617 [Populus alba x Populus x berolinensis]
MPNSNGQAAAAVPVQMNHIEAQLVDEEDGDNNNIAGGGEESIDNTNSIQFEDGGCSGVVGEAVAASDMYVNTNGGGGADYGLVTANNDQLTLSFQGEVYVFDAVAPDKVQAVLLLLGGYEIPSGIPAMGTVPINQRTPNHVSPLAIHFIYLLMRCCFILTFMLPRASMTCLELEGQFNLTELLH